MQPKPKKIIAGIFFFLLWVLGKPVMAATSFDVYIWQKPVSKSIHTNAQPLIDQLKTETLAIVNTQPLAPLILAYSDQPDEGYAMYHDRGRIITTLAMSYPYVSADVQTKIKSYVAGSLSSGAEAFFTNKYKNINEGHQRRLHNDATYIPTDRIFKNISTLYVLYGIWLYGENTGDWTTVQTYWSQIKTFYQANKSSNILYGSLSGYIGMIRMAKQMNDTSLVSSIESDITTQFTAALNPTTIETRQKSTSYGYFSNDERKVDYFPGHPWMYLNISPEIARFIGDNPTIKNDYLSRLNSMQSVYSPWWLYQVPVFTRWTGDEGIGGTPELLGMFFPAERRIKNTSPQELEKYMRSIPTGIGDSYWIESLVSTIESFGQSCWKNMQTNAETCGNLPPVTPIPTSMDITPTMVTKKADGNADGIVNGLDYIVWLTNFGTTTSQGTGKGDYNGDTKVNGLDYIVWITNFGK